MRTLIRIAIPATAAIALAACASPGKIESAKTVQAAGSPFTTSLSRNYGEYTAFEADKMYDWPDADHFAEKTLRAAEGKRVAPERPEEWDIDRADWRNELQQARAALVTAYRGGFREAAPDRAASAQANYDCWVEQAEEGWQYDHIAKCREGFMAAMQQQEAVVDAPPPVLVFFDWDVARIPTEAMSIIDAVAQVAQENRDMMLQVTGHADRSGSVPYNNELSEQRARNVAQALANRGVAMDRIDVGWKGELDPRVPTGDGVREPENRRVVIESVMPRAMAMGGQGGMSQTSMQ